MTLRYINAQIERIEKGLTDCSWVVCIFVTLMIVVDIFLRFFFNQPLPASWEISEILMPYIVFFPFAYTATINAHVRVSLIRDRMPERVRLGFDLLSYGICSLMCAFMTYWSWLRFVESFATREEILAAIKLPWWFGKLAMPIGFGMFALRYFVNFLLNLKERRA